jgi:hypothetical protein
MRRTSLALLLFALLVSGCSATRPAVPIEVTGYCNCGQCCGWERGSWKFLKLDFWNRYNTTGSQKGQLYSGLTARGTDPHEPQPGVISLDTVKHPWMLPVRLVMPWLWLAKDGTIAADTKYYPFGTRMYIPGYGYGVVEDRGSAIKGIGRLDAYYDSHQEALNWGRRKVKVRVLN